MLLIGFILRIYHNAQSSECQIDLTVQSNIWLQLWCVIYLLFQYMASGWAGHYSFRCQPVDYSNSPMALRVSTSCIILIMFPLHVSVTLLHWVSVCTYIMLSALVWPYHFQACKCSSCLVISFVLIFRLTWMNRWIY